MKRQGFTLIELLVVIGILGLLSTFITVQLQNAREKAYRKLADAELQQIFKASEIFLINDGDVYPPDEPRRLPAEFVKYLGNGDWPDAPWPGSVYDWDNITAGNMGDAPYEQYVQISIRFCDQGDTSLASCRFPDEDWVDANWDENSSAYYCIEGPCRSHPWEDYDHASYCFNCGN